MKKPRYTDQQIAQALRQAEQGTAVAEVCRRLGVSETTFYLWKKRYAGMGVAELRCGIWTQRRDYYIGAMTSSSRRARR